MVRAGRARKSSRTMAPRSPAVRPDRPTRTATASSRSGTWCSCSTCRKATTLSATCRVRASTPAWVSNASPASCRAQQNVFETDTFQRADRGQRGSLIGARADAETIASHRVIADHLRSTSFLMADGVLPSNEGRGYVLRRIMRRAMRHAHLLGRERPADAPPRACTGDRDGRRHYPELARAQPLIEEVLEREETRFRQTLDKGLRLLDEATAGLGEGGELPGETAFKLYDTLRLPLRPDRRRAARPRHRRRQGRVRRGDGAAEGRRARCVEGFGRRGRRRGLVRHRRTRRLDRVHRLHLDRGRGPRGRAGRGRQGSRSSAEAGQDVTRADQPDPVLRRERRPGGRCRVRSPGPHGLAIAVADTAKPLGRLHAMRGTIEQRQRSPWATRVHLDRRCRAARPHPRQPFGYPPAPRRAAQCARRAMSRRRVRWSPRTGCASTSRIPRR